MREREKSPKKTVSVSIERKKAVAPRVVLARQFSLRTERKDGLVEILIETDNKAAQPERIILDGCFLSQNQQSLAQYAASLPGDPDDSVVNTDIAFSAHSSYANIIEVGRLGPRAETCFSIVSLHDWGTAVRDAKPSDELSLESSPVLAVYSDVGFQKKLLSEILRIFGT
jgi:hypothetical protein